MRGVIRSEVVATVVLIAVALGVSGCKSSGSSAAAKTTPASSTAAATPSSGASQASGANSAIHRILRRRDRTASSGK